MVDLAAWTSSSSAVSRCARFSDLDAGGRPVASWNGHGRLVGRGHLMWHQMAMFREPTAWWNIIFAGIIWGFVPQRYCCTWVLLGGTKQSIPAVCKPNPPGGLCAPRAPAHKLVHVAAQCACLPCVCRILALFINVIKILHFCVTDTHLEVICKWLKQQWSESARSRPPRVLPQQLKKCILQKMLT